MARQRNRSTYNRVSPSPVMIVISVGFVAAVAAVLLWRNPKTAQKRVDAVPTRALKAQSRTEQNTATPPRRRSQVSQAALQTLSAPIRGPLSHSLRRVSDAETSKFLAALAARLLVWKVDLRRELRRGDHIRIVYRPVQEQSRFQIEAMSYLSSKHNKTYKFYRFHPNNQTFAVYYDEKGRSIEQYLEHTPLPIYDQVTSILKMRPRHKGVDFKAPVGTPIVLPFRARVVQKNWNVRYNGSCIKLEFVDKTWKGQRVEALFLHLHKIEAGVKEGVVLPAGVKIAEVGNTGRSTAPHLHYQLQTRKQKIIDPFQFHRTHTKNVPTDRMDSFQAQHRSLDAVLGR